MKKKELTYQEFMGQMRYDIDCIYPAYVSQRGINAAYVMTDWHIDSMISEENFIGCTRVDSLEDLSSSDLYQWFCEFDGNTAAEVRNYQEALAQGNLYLAKFQDEYEDEEILFIH